MKTFLKNAGTNVSQSHLSFRPGLTGFVFCLRTLQRQLIALRRLVQCASQQWQCQHQKCKPFWCSLVLNFVPRSGFVFHYRNKTVHGHSQVRSRCDLSNPENSSGNATLERTPHLDQTTYSVTALHPVHQRAERGTGLQLVESVRAVRRAGTSLRSRAEPTTVIVGRGPGD